MRLYIYIVLQICLPVFSFAQNADEFTGPYKSWVDVKKRFGAYGDGKHDDTKALQAALDSLTSQPAGYNTGRNAYTVIYLPAGTYRISSTLRLAGKIGISFVGQDPANTFIKWYGPDNDTMFWANGSAYYKLSRISWDANNAKNVHCIGIYWKNRWNNVGSQSFASLNIEISDCVFTGGCTVGISGGTYNDSGTGMNDSEITILRCAFYKCLHSAIHIRGFNALDYWIWDCRFVDCRGGVELYNGNYHVYRSYFEGSQHLDVMNGNGGYYTSVRNSFSNRSRGFSWDGGNSCNPFKRTFQSNVVNPTSYINIGAYHLGKLTLFDNVIRKGQNREDSSVVTYHSWCAGNYEVLSVNNRYESLAPYKIATAKKDVFSIKDGRVDSKSFANTKTFFASQQTIPLKTNRTVFEVPANAGSAAIQSVIDKAAALQGQRPVVHLPYGTYTLSRPLEIPANSDMQIAGDGYINGTVLVKAAGFPPGKALIYIYGPSYITMRDIQVGDYTVKYSTDAIIMSGVDQPGANVFIDQLNSLSDNAVHLDGMDYLYVQKDNSFFSAGNKVTGGKLMQEGKGTAGLYCFGGQYAKLSVQNNGRFVAKDCWWEGAERVPLQLEGSGNITIDGFMLAPQTADSNVSVSIGSFKGKITIMNGYLQGGVAVNGNNPNLDLFLWNIHFYHKLDPLQFTRQKTSYRGAFAGLTTQCFTTKPECQNIMSVDDKLMNISNRNQFIEEMVAQNRSATPKKYSKASGKASNIFMTRVAVGQCNTGIRFIK